MPPPKKRKTNKSNTKKTMTSESCPNPSSASPPPVVDANSEQPIPIDPPEPLLNPPSSQPKNLEPPPSSPSPRPPSQSEEAEQAAQEPAAPTTAATGGEEDEPPQSMPPAPDAAPPDVSVPDLPAVHHRPAPLPRKPPTKLKKPLSSKQRAVAKQKLNLLSARFLALPFSAEEARAAVDLPAHEALFRALGLWDFAHLPLDGDVRPDLLIPLIANYDQPNRRSFVHDLRISVSRADLARALMLPVKKDKGSCLEPGAVDPIQEVYSREESAAAVLNFMSGFMLFQFQDDACILPAEVVAVNRLVKEGQLHKVDWAGLIWLLVEKELLEAPNSGVCHYASHLQRLMKHQQPRLFQEAESKLEPVPEVEVEVETENSADVAMVEYDDDDGGADAEAEDGMEDPSTRIRNPDAFRDVGEEKHGPGLSLGLGGDMAMADGFEQFKEAEERWLQDEDNQDTEHCLRRCNSSGVRNMEFENLCKPDGEGRGEEAYVDDLSAKYASFERMSSFDRLASSLTSTDLLHVLDNVNPSYSQPVNSLLPSGEFLTMRTDSQKNMPVEHSHDRSFFVGNNNGKRQIGEIDDEEEDDEDTQFTQNNQQKRMRTGAIWNSPSELDDIMEQIELYAGKARMLSAEKEQARMNAQLQLQYLNEMLQQKDRVIQSLEKTRVEEQQKWHLEACRYEHEINVMANLIIGYKKALKETRRTFTEYRKTYPQGNEPLYKDAGSGGLVLTVKELEIQRLEKEEEIRGAVVEIIDGFEKEWLNKFEHHASSLVSLFGRMVELQENIKHMKERFAKSGTSDA
ncbi:hypothetical protein Cni_G09473 [Canna indica]|uniref:Uncharacterized protein n=1 Tax=Canna indica TaxID=4628 RepID=A0AAQ3K2D6_9LILI|nr:hypothetical protein Cni_G09473 [Canna indica]